MKNIDLNSDLGEQGTSGLDTRIMPYISSCNIACGGHAGSETIFTRTVGLAAENNVAIGAHPGFPDKENFGRVPMDISKEDLYQSLKEQVLLAKHLTEEAGQLLHHVKPHGALFNLAGVDRSISELIANCLSATVPGVVWYGLAHSVSEEVAKERKIPFAREAFADRRYEPNRTLTSRKKEGAVLYDTATVLGQVEELTFKQRARSGDNWLEIKAQTICLHSDTDGAVHLAKTIHNYLIEKGARIIAV